MENITDTENYKELLELELQIQKAKKLQSQVWRKFWSEDNVTMSMDEFWALIDMFKAFLTVEGGLKNSKSAIKKFIYSDQFCSLGSMKAEWATKLVDFCKIYRSISEKLYKPLFDVITGFGDDSYSDILDAFPLFGKERYEKALRGEIVGTSENQYQGEHYIGSTFESYVERFVRDEAHYYIWEER